MYEIKQSIKEFKFFKSIKKIKQNYSDIYINKYKNLDRK